VCASVCWCVLVCAMHTWQVSLLPLTSKAVGRNAAAETHISDTSIATSSCILCFVLVAVAMLECCTRDYAV
jgi:hypothetical protein